MQQLKIAIIHEMLIKLWWAEKVVEKLCSIFPLADLHTLIYDESKVWSIFPKDNVIVAKQTKIIYKLFKNQRFCLPFMPSAIESFDLSTYDVVICSSSWFAHWAITKPETKFIVYYHSPARYLWDWTNEYKKDIWWNDWIKWFLLNSLFLKLRIWDFIASNRVDINLANSNNSANRVKKYYKKDCEILYPPVETARFNKKINKSWVLEKCLMELKLPEKENTWKNWYYIIISALTEFKKIEIAIEWFNKMPTNNLVIIWDWNYKNTLLNKVNWENILFTGSRFGDELVELVQWSSWLIFPGEEDFWIVPIEAMANWKAIFAFRWWWLLETVIENKTWNFFDDKNWYDFVPKFLEFDKKVKSTIFNRDFIINHAKKFDEIEFENRIKEIVYS